MSLRHVHRIPSQCVSDFRRSQRLLFANLGFLLFLLQNSREAGQLSPRVLRRPDGNDPVRLLDLALMVLVHLASARPRFFRRRVDPLTPGSSLEHPERGQPLRFEQWPRELVHNVPDSARACVPEVSTHGVWLAFLPVVGSRAARLTEGDRMPGRPAGHFSGLCQGRFLFRAWLIVGSRRVDRT